MSGGNSSEWSIVSLLSVEDCALVEGVTEEDVIEAVDVPFELAVGVAIISVSRELVARVVLSSIAVIVAIILKNMIAAPIALIKREKALIEYWRQLKSEESAQKSKIK